MATTKGYRGDGVIIANHLIIRTGTTITAGMPIIGDLSGTNVVSHCTALAEASGFIGILLETLTGPHTGITYATEGLWEFTGAASTTEGFTGCQLAPGMKVYIVSGLLVRGWSDTAATLTGVKPIGIACEFPNGPLTSGTTRTVLVKIMPQMLMPDVLVVTN